VHHDRGPHIYGVKKAYDYVAWRPRLFQPVIPAVVAHRELVDGVAVEVQTPDFAAAEKEYVLMTQRESATEMEGHVPAAQYAFDTGVLTREWTPVIESAGKHWVSEIECSRHINWAGQWRRVDDGASEWRTPHPERFRPLAVTG
jgi:hypothetical protein